MTKNLKPPRLYLNKTLPKHISFSDIKECQAHFRIGFFLNFSKESLNMAKSFRNYLRKVGYTSTFLAIDYPNSPWKNTSTDKTNFRQKSFDLVDLAHTQFFIIEKNVGKGGVVSEMEHYNDKVFPINGITGVAFTEYSSQGNWAKNETSSVIQPLMETGHFNEYPFLNMNQLREYLLSAANQQFMQLYSSTKVIQKLTTSPKFRLLCDICHIYEAHYLCLDERHERCNKYHICDICLSTNHNKNMRCKANLDSFYLKTHSS